MAKCGVEKGNIKTGKGEERQCLGCRQKYETPSKMLATECTEGSVVPDPAAWRRALDNPLWAIPE